MATENENSSRSKKEEPLKKFATCSKKDGDGKKEGRKERERVKESRRVFDASASRASELPFVETRTVSVKREISLTCRG